jgi:hypothetical protein
MPCSPLKLNRRFGGTYGLHIQSWWIRRARNQPESKWQESVLRPWRWRRYILPKSRLIFNGLYGVVSQKILLFITTAVRTSNPTYLTLFGRCFVVSFEKFKINKTKLKRLMESVLTYNKYYEVSRLEICVTLRERNRLSLRTGCWGEYSKAGEISVMRNYIIYTHQELL